jgi:hypothetical protein
MVNAVIQFLLAKVCVVLLVIQVFLVFQVSSVPDSYLFIY